MWMSQRGSAAAAEMLPGNNKSCLVSYLVYEGQGGLGKHSSWRDTHLF